MEECERVARVNFYGREDSLDSAMFQQLVRLETSEEDSSSNKYILRYAAAEEWPDDVIGKGYIEINLDIVNEGVNTYVIGGTAETDNPETFDVSPINEYLASISSFINNDSGIGIERPQAGSGNTSIVTNTDGKQVNVSTEAINSGKEVLYYINYVRLFLNAVDSDEYAPMQIGYLIIYIVLVVLTGMFAIRYMKRVIYVAFLTLMAPLVALTYPIDKIKDRKSASL